MSLRLLCGIGKCFCRPMNVTTIVVHQRRKSVNGMLWNAAHMAKSALHCNSGVV